jgi:virginiamycin B lyase
MWSRPIRPLSIAVLALTLLLITACSGGADTDTTTATQPGTSSPAAELPAPEDIEAAGAKRLSDMGAADWMVMAAGSAWVSGLGDLLNEVGRLDGQTGKILKSVEMPGQVCMGMDVGYGSVWAASCTPPAVTRINAKTAAVQAKITIAAGGLPPESSLAAGEGAVWVLTDDPTPQLVKINPRSNKVEKTVAAPAGATAIRAGVGGLWVTAADSGTLTRLDPGDLSVVTEVQVGAGGRFLTVGEGAVWVLTADDGKVVRVDPATNKPVANIQVSTGPVSGGDIAVGGGSVWARVTDELATRIDPASNKVVARYGPPAGSGGIAADDRAAWIAAHDSQTVWRLPLS